MPRNLTVPGYARSLTATVWLNRSHQATKAVLQVDTFERGEEWHRIVDFVNEVYGAAATTHGEWAQLLRTLADHLDDLDNR